MAVLVIAEVEGQTEQGYDGMVEVLSPLLRQTPGFLAQGGGRSRDGWRSFEVWSSAEAATRFFATYIRPNLPPGVTPKRTIVELRNLIVVPDATGPKK